MQVLSSKLRQEAVLNTLTSDVLKSSEIGGVNLDADKVRTALARQLNVRVSLIKTTDHNIESIVQMVMDATERYDKITYSRKAIRLECGALS